MTAVAGISAVVDITAVAASTGVAGVTGFDGVPVVEYILYTRLQGIADIKPTYTQ